MRINNLGCNSIVLGMLLLAVAASSHASGKKQWVTLNDCRYVDSENNDGDSFRVRCGDQEFTTRLYFVDTPETNLRYPERTREQSVHFGITLDETMKAGVQASERVRTLLENPFVVETVWAAGGGRGREPRYDVLIEVDGRNLAEILISEGLARAKGVGRALPSGEKSRDYMDRLTALEAEAQAKRIGAWSTSAVSASQAVTTPPAPAPAPTEPTASAPAPLPTTPAATSLFGEYPANYKEIISVWMKTNRLDASQIEWQGEPKPANIPTQNGRDLYGYLVIFNTPEHSHPKTRSVLIHDGVIVNNSGF
jgi:endonuclease YncB( thermonuclease family)